MLITELQGNIVYPWKSTGNWGNKLFTYEFETDDELLFRVYFDEILIDGDPFTLFDLSFGQVITGEVKFSSTGTGDALAVFSTVIDICQHFLQNQSDADVLKFSGLEAEDSNSSRIRLYTNAAPRMAQRLNRTALVKKLQNRVIVYLVKSDAELVDKVRKFFNIQ